MRFSRVRAGNMSDVVDEVECNIVPPDSPTNQVYNAETDEEIKEASIYMAQTIRHGLLIVSIIMVDNLK
jgi:hypothetical protein